MPNRILPIITNQTYHVFNRSVGSIQIFETAYDYRRFLGLINYYRYMNPPMRYSRYTRLPSDERQFLFKTLSEQNSPQVIICAFCVMPNHIHFLLRQTEKNGITNFMKKIQNAYAKYFNKKESRNGSLFQLMYKAKLIESEEQLKHVVRYIHLNPLTSYLISAESELKLFKWTSFGSYCGSQIYPFVETKFVMKLFSDNPDRFTAFTFDQLDYQRKLARMKHLI